MSKQRLLPSLIFAVLLGAVLWPRWPSFATTLWNVDEAIHAAVARTLTDGGTLYRDAIDQRTPLSYYAVAAVFGVAGANNLFAVRLVVAVLIALTGFGLFLLGRRTHTTAPQLFGRGNVEPQATPYLVACTADEGRLQRLELLVDGQVVDGASVAPCSGPADNGACDWTFWSDPVIDCTD